MQLLSPTLSESMQRNDRRRGVRHPLMGELTGLLVDPVAGRLINCLAVDVSRDGLGIVAFEKLQPGQELVLIKNKRRVKLAVVWCHADCGKTKTFSCGLVRGDAGVDIETLFRNVCFRDE